MFHSYFERKTDKVLTFNIEISASLQLMPPSNKFQNLINAGGAY